MSTFPTELVERCDDGIGYPVEVRQTGPIYTVHTLAPDGDWEEFATHDRAKALEYCLWLVSGKEKVVQP